ncbi:hypothetical protein LRP88_05458 [Fusarium phalaenopsidis]
MPRARARAVEFYDDNQRQKITSYNIRLVVSAARRHIRQHLSDLWERRPVFLRVALSLETERCKLAVLLLRTMMRMRPTASSPRTRRSSWNAARRIVRWVTTGSRREMIIHKDDLLGPDDIKPLVLASDCIEQERRGLEELSRMLLDRLLFWSSFFLISALHRVHTDSIKKSISASFTSQSSIIPVATIIKADPIIIIYTVNSNYTMETEPVPKRELASERGANVKTEGEASLAEDDDVISVGTKSLSSAPAPGRCSCGGLCNHDATVTSAPTPAPAPDMALERKPVVSRSSA